MGATFPALVRHFTRWSAVGYAFGRLYSANTLGADRRDADRGPRAHRVFGLSGALRIGAGCSAVAGDRGLVARSRRRKRSPAPITAAVVDAPAVARPAPRAIPWLALVVAFVSGLTSLGYQVTWTRLLASGTGDMTYVFTVILALFLIGIAIGAMLFNIFRPRISDPIRLLAVTPARCRGARHRRARRS